MKGVLSMKSLKVFSVIASLGIVATAAVGGVALANNADLKSGINAAASDHSLTMNYSNFMAYSDSTSSVTYYGWPITSLAAGVNEGESKVTIGASGSSTNANITLPTVNTTTYSGACYKSITVSGIEYTGSSQFKIYQIFAGGSENGQAYSGTSASLNCIGSVVALRLENFANAGTITFTSVSVTYYC
jgi:hypothetical protein